MLIRTKHFLSIVKKRLCAVTMNHTKQLSMFWEKGVYVLGWIVPFSVIPETYRQGVTKKCRPSWLTDSALVYEPKCGGGGLRGLSQWVHSCAHGAQINFGDLTPYLTYICLQMSNRSAYRALNENEFIIKTVKNLGYKKQVFVHTYITNSFGGRQP